MTPEGAVVRAIMDLLAAERVPALRLNTAGFKVEGGRTIYTHSGGKGVADILAFPRLAFGTFHMVWPLWIEAKSAKGKQSPEQVNFQHWVVDHGMAYIVARSSDDVLAWLKANR